MSDSDPVLTARERLHRSFEARRAMSPATWLSRVWARAVLMTPGGDDVDVTETLRAEWAEFRTSHPSEPVITFRPPADIPDEIVKPEAPKYDNLVPLAFGEYGAGHLPSHAERVREEQERLSRRDQAYYGF